MKSTIILLFAVFCWVCISAEQKVLQHYSPHYVEKFLETDFSAGRFHSVFAKKPAQSIPEISSRLFSADKQTQDSKVRPSPSSQDRGPFYFIPKFEGALKPGQSISWSAECFRKNTATLTESNGRVQIDIKAEDAVSTFCYDIYLIANSEQFYTKFVFFHGDHTLSFNVDQLELADIQRNGMQIFFVYEEILGTLEDIIDTVLLFFQPWDEKDSLAFVKERMNLTYEPRATGYINIPENEIPDGTYMATQRFDGSEVMIQYGTGSTSGHSVFAIRINGTLHVCESTGKNQPDYWPPPYGVICHEYAKWITLAQKANYLVTLMPLRPDLRQKWNATAAQQFVKSSLGLYYGFSNFIWGWIDTVTGNFPPPLTEQFLQVAMSIFSRLDPSQANLVYIAGLNKRLGTNCTFMDCIVETLLARNITMGEVYVMPEQDRWVYPDGRNMVCDVFVLETYKAAGIFDVEFQATEFTPKDLYTLKIWDTEWKKSHPQCDQTDGLGACQILGGYHAIFTGWNTIEPYPHMCESCNSLWPNYERTPQNC